METMKPQTESTNTQLNSLLESTQKRLKSVMRDRLSEKKSETRNEIYKFISNDVKNDDFKSYIEEKINKLKDEIGPLVESQLKSEMNSFNKVVENIIKKHQENMDDILKYHINDKFNQSNLTFHIDFKINNGINVSGLISSIGGAAVLVWTAFFASNPIGWAAGTILGAIGLVFSFYKAIRSFFSTDYKMEQQRKSADSNLQNVFDAIENKLLDNVVEACKELTSAMEKLKNNLQATLNAGQRTVNSLNLIVQQVSKLREKLI